MIDPEVRVQIRRYFYAEHWKVGTIAQALGVHPETVRRAIEVERFHRAEQLCASILDPYLPFVRQTLEAHPRLRATRLHQMLRDRGYTGSVEQLRRVVARLRRECAKLWAGHADRTSWVWPAIGLKPLCQWRNASSKVP